MNDQSKRIDDTAPAGTAGEADAETGSATAQAGELDALRAENEQLRARCEENWQLYLGAQAEMQNVRRRAERDVQDAHRFALERFIKELLPVKDSLELGLSAAGQDNADVEKLREGSELILRGLNAAIEKFGVEEINPLGERFDPERHQALAMQPATDTEANTVLQVVQKGYLLNGRLVREARVIVARGPGGV